LIGKLASLRSGIESAIRETPVDYITSSDITSLAEYPGVDIDIDSSAYNDNDELKTVLEENSETYALLIENEINTILLKKHILSSMVAIQTGLFNRLTVNYEPHTISLTGVSFSDGSLDINLSSFKGTSGQVFITLTVYADTDTGGYTTSATPAVKYKLPDDPTVTYTKPDDTEGTGTLSAPSSVLFRYNKNTLTIEGTESMIDDDFYLSSKKSIHKNFINVLEYTMSTYIDIKGAETISISGLTRDKSKKSTKNGSFVDSVESISGTVDITIMQTTVSG
jgi:hypothetical protein